MTLANQGRCDGALPCQPLQLPRYNTSSHQGLEHQRNARTRCSPTPPNSLTHDVPAQSHTLPRNQQLFRSDNLDMGCHGCALDCHCTTHPPIPRPWIQCVHSRRSVTQTGVGMNHHIQSSTQPDTTPLHVWDATPPSIHESGQHPPRFHQSYERPSEMWIRRVSYPVGRGR